MIERGFGFPRFKKAGQYRSFVFPQFKSNPVKGFQIKLPKIGAMPINLHRSIPDGFVVKQVRVINKASGWYAQLILQSDVSVPDVMPNGNSIGIDVGLEKFLAVSNGQLVERPRFFNSMHGELRWLQRKLKNKTKGSANYRKVQHKIPRLHERIYDTRKQFHINTAHALCDGSPLAVDGFPGISKVANPKGVGMIFAEDLNLKMTSRGMLAKHCLDAAWSRFLEILSWVCWKRGVYFAKVNPNGTSQTCPQCGTHTGKKKLSERVHVCHECGYTTDRDVAAAMVVEQRGLAAAGLAVKLPVEVTPAGDASLGTTREAGMSYREVGSPHHNL
jgi:putative transposase